MEIDRITLCYYSHPMTSRETLDRDDDEQRGIGRWRITENGVFLRLSLDRTWMVYTYCMLETRQQVVTQEPNMAKAYREWLVKHKGHIRMLID